MQSGARNQILIHIFSSQRSAHAPSADYLHLTKGFGHIAASQLPLHYALALKSWSPIQYLTRLSHEELNPYHRLLGRVIITFFSLHASMYLNFYIQKGLLLKRIQDLASSSDSKTPRSQNSVPLLIEGPYGSAAHFPDLASFDRVLFVAGGVGATFTLPLFIDLMQRGKMGERIPTVKFVWTVRDRPDARWGFELLREHLGEGPFPGVELFITSAGYRPNEPQDNDSEEIELREREHLISDADGNSNTSTSIVTKKGRPDLRVPVDQVFNSSPDDGVAVLVCGPKGMGQSVRREVGRWVLGKGRDVFWHGEEFGW